MVLDGSIPPASALDQRRLVEATSVFMADLRSVRQEYLHMGLGVVMVAVSNQDAKSSTLARAISGQGSMLEAIHVVREWAETHRNPQNVLRHLLRKGHALRKAEKATVVAHRRAALNQLQISVKSGNGSPYTDRLVDALISALGGCESSASADDTPSTIGTESREVTNGDPTTNVYRERLEVVEAKCAHLMAALEQATAQLNKQRSDMAALRDTVASLEARLVERPSAPPSSAPLPDRVDDGEISSLDSLPVVSLEQSEKLRTLSKSCVDSEVLLEPAEDQSSLGEETDPVASKQKGAGSRTLNLPEPSDDGSGAVLPGSDVVIQLPLRGVGGEANESAETGAKRSTSTSRTPTSRAGREVAWESSLGSSFDVEAIALRSVLRGGPCMSEANTRSPASAPGVRKTSGGRSSPSVGEERLDQQQGMPRTTSPINEGSTSRMSEPRGLALGASVDLDCMGVRDRETSRHAASSGIPSSWCDRMQQGVGLGVSTLGREDGERHEGTNGHTLGAGGEASVGSIGGARRIPPAAVSCETACADPSFLTRVSRGGGTQGAGTPHGGEVRVAGDSRENVFIYDEDGREREVLASHLVATEQDSGVRNTGTGEVAVKLLQAQDKRTRARAKNEAPRAAYGASPPYPRPSCAAGRAPDVGSSRAMERERIGILEEAGVGFLYNAAELDEQTFRLEETAVALGGCSDIYRVRMRRTEQQRAVDEFTEERGLVVKVVQENAPYFQKEAILREISLVKRLQPGCHPNVVDYVSSSENKLSIVMKEEGRDLQNMLDEKTTLEGMGRGGRMRLLASGVRGLEYLHSRGITHMDLKPANFMVDEGMTTLKIADLGFGGRTHMDAIAGGTREYMSPETVAHQYDPETPPALLDPSFDAWGIGMTLLQMLFVQELPRTDPSELSIHGLIPRGEPFLTSIRNVEYLSGKALQTGSLDDERRLKEAEAIHEMLMTDFAMQQIKMQDLTCSILCPGKWEEPGGLRFRNEVNKVLLSLLDPNPLRRIRLSSLLTLLECEDLWAPEDAVGARIPAHVLELLEKIDHHMSHPEHTSRGVWWADRSWWNYPPPVSLIPELW